MNPLKKLASETAIYGVSSILGRFLNWLLVPLYTYVFVPEEYGIVTNLMSYVAILLVLLTYGMETGYFRFASKEKDSSLTFSTGFISLLVTSSIFLILIALFLTPISHYLDIADHKEYIIMLSLTLGFDAITALPFAKLRMENRAFRYAGLKLVNIFSNLGINLFFLVLCPWLHHNYPDLQVTRIWSADIGIGYIFYAFGFSSILNLILLTPDLVKIKLRLSWSLLKEILKYSAPILVVSICGMININFDKMMMPELIPSKMDPLYQTGIYGANYKLAVIMTLFIQAFRYAFEPFFFAQANQNNSKQIYADVLKYFTVFGLLIFLGVMFYLDLVKMFIGSGYHEGIGIVPYVLMGNFFFGIFFSLSLWYKLSDKTKYGAIIAVLGSVITIVLNLILVPKIGYYGAAYAVLICFVVMSVISYLWGQKHYPVPYDLKSISLYFAIALVLFGISTQISLNNQWMDMLVKTPLLLIFIGIFIQKEGLWLSLLKLVKRR